MDISSLRERRDYPAQLTVSELNAYIKRIIETDKNLNAVSVKGEISNFTRHRTGHLYFSLKDEECQIKAVMFRSAASSLKFVPENGMKVIVRGSIGIFMQGGSYQLYVNSIQPDGIGALYLAYEQLKAKLEAEGLFSVEHKKIIPSCPKRIGVITSPTGAAVRDIINVTSRRFPIADVYIYPSQVQGEYAESELLTALDYFETSKLCDVIIIGRGGGSIEDLWAFNSEKLARKIFSCETPIISAVGHETDFTICDFVADLRAPTPSAAAEIAVPDSKELLMRIASVYDRCSNALLRIAERKSERLSSIKEKIIFAESYPWLEDRYEKLNVINEKLIKSVSELIKDKEKAIGISAGKLDALSPLATLSRGYAVISKNDAVIKKMSDVDPGDNVIIRLSDGELVAEVKNKVEI